MKKLLSLFVLLPFFMCAGFIMPVNDHSERNHEEQEWDTTAMQAQIQQLESDDSEEVEPKKDFIKWIDFNVKKEVLAAAQKKHKTFLEQGITDIGTCEILAYVAVRNGNKFNIKKDNARIKAMTAEDVRKLADNKYYKYHVESHHAVLDGIIDTATGDTIGYFPLARGYWYNHADDFGNDRGYGYKRRHLGNDLFGGTGTPVIAVEGGTVTQLGWNRYGGWRVGIRSEDTKRYYYYAHLRKGRPFAADLEIGDKVEAGDVIGYLGNTGYSTKEDRNMDSKPHLHFGMQIIFDKSQEDGIGELWIDVYQINRFLTSKRAQVVRNPETKEYTHVKSNKYLFPKPE